MLETKEICVSYGSISAVTGASLKTEKGMLAAVLGPNGAGKSTLLNTIAGLLKPKSGTILFKGEDVTGLESHELVRRGLVLIPEGRHVVGNMSIRENLLLGTVSRKQESNLEKVYDLLPVLQEKQSQKAGLLSGGEQQMLAIGRAMMSDPEMMMIDEPTLGLSPIMASRILSFVRQLTESGKTVVLVEQNMQKAVKIADAVYFMQKGRLSAVQESVENAQKMMMGFVNLS